MSALAKRAPPAAHFSDITVRIPAAFALESGDALADTHIQIRRFGNEAGPQIVALGGISSGRDVCSDHGWWRDTLRLPHRNAHLGQVLIAPHAHGAAAS